jgi:hypothetical protein
LNPLSIEEILALLDICVKQKPSIDRNKCIATISAVCPYDAVSSNVRSAMNPFLAHCVNLARPRVTSN